jgi:hypothetical protein
LLFGFSFQPIDAETQKAMMAWHYKQQKEQKVFYKFKKWFTDSLELPYCFLD